MDQQQQQQIVEDKNELPSLGWLFGGLLIFLFGVGVLKWMWQNEINNYLNIPPS